ncbi:MAG: LPS export ABC transporter ATP-binding protein [Burkholderiales bacterium]|nr:LPS export ABC transporter ATP-binding protein [Burkholderiales bacterium]OUT77869.1 MAG: LPS export ABC transporter ATP-binding protein [Betaproteobacteria bacterium TMED22]|tara:strand:+ start:992 stop:1702 length:711 start_codon:yes stop_codon:yes gene_type:complete
MLKASKLNKKYRSKTVVNDVSIEVARGEIIGLLGPNGAGKTTTFYMIVGITPCTNGNLTLDGTDITHLPIHRRAELGISYLPQETSIFRKLNTEDNIRAILELQQQVNISERLEQLLDELSITHLRKNSVTSLSGGERRRVEIARALASDPSFILLDEPFAGVDPLAILDIKEIIRYLVRQKIGVIITDHNVRETLDICDRAYIVNEGAVLADGDPDEIIKNASVRKVYLGDHFRL